MVYILLYFECYESHSGVFETMEELEEYVKEESLITYEIYEGKLVKKE